MKDTNLKSSPLYTYNSKTHTFSFNTGNKHGRARKKSIIPILIAIVVIAIVVGFYFFHNSQSGFELSRIPAYSGSPYIEINNNIPFFTEEEKQLGEYEVYSELDSLGRCGVAFANLTEEMMPDYDRKSLISVTPTGWINEKYDFIDGGYLYNRCHLIGFQLTGQGANPQNLITGTRYFNVEGMLPFENRVANYLWLSHNHVLYRVTPIFNEKNLLASGVEIEGWSIEDSGENICFNVFVYNVQPGIIIDYKTGNSYLDN